MVLPEGSAIPPGPYLLVLAAGAIAVVGFLWRERPPVSEGVIVALAPWMVVGACFHVLFQVDGIPSSVAPLFGTPAVYGTTAIVAAAVWAISLQLSAPPPRVLGVSGTVLLVGAVVATLAVGGVVLILVPLAALAVGVAIGLLTWASLRHIRPDAVATSGAVGLLVVLAHAIDGASTAAGVDLLGFGERTPASRAIMDLAAALPTADLLGVGWLFLLVKVAVASVIVVLFEEYVREEPSQARVLLGLIAAVGLGPGAHNLLLFTVAGG